MRRRDGAIRERGKEKEKAVLTLLVLIKNKEVIYIRNFKKKPGGMEKSSAELRFSG